MKGDVWAVLTPYTSQADADLVRGLHRAVVNDAFRLAPDADMLIANDRKWWEVNRDALQFAGDKYGFDPPPGVVALRHDRWIASGSDSGSTAIHRAIERGAKRVLLLGFHMHDRHKFPRHAAPLRNTPQHLFVRWIAHYGVMAQRLRGKVEVLNCTPGSALKCFPIVNLAEAVEPAAA